MTLAWCVVFVIWTSCRARRALWRGDPGPPRRLTMSSMATRRSPRRRASSGRPLVTSSRAMRRMVRFSFGRRCLVQCGLAAASVRYRCSSTTPRSCQPAGSRAAGWPSSTDSSQWARSSSAKGFHTVRASRMAAICTFGRRLPRASRASAAVSRQTGSSSTAIPTAPSPAWPVLARPVLGRGENRSRPAKGASSSISARAGTRSPARTSQATVRRAASSGRRMS